MKNKLFSISENTEKRIDELLLKMTLEEKVGQMCQFRFLNNDEQKRLIREGKIGSLFGISDAAVSNELQRIAVEESRLGIPVIFANDVIHGCHTSFPIPLAEACSWNPELIEEAEAVAAMEASAIGTHWLFAPMLDVARDPRWGRVAEGAGEDTFLTSSIAKARIKGMQRNNWGTGPRIVACPKHFAAYGAAEGGRDCNVVEISEKTLREVYLPPFKSAIEAGAGTIMTGYHDLNGIPISANSLLLKTILRDEWGFEGIALSDWQTISDLQTYGVASSLKDAAEKAANAGQDMDMHSEGYFKYLVELVRENKVTEEVIDEAVRRILRVKFWVGLFDEPYTDPSLEKSVVLSKDNLNTALNMAKESIVLLKNENDLLPLNSDIKSVAVIGELADNRKEPLGTWNFLGNPKNVVTVLEAVKRRVAPGTKVYYSKGCEINGNSTDDIPAAVEIVKKSDAAIVVLGESVNMSGEGNCNAYLDLPGKQEMLLKALYETGTPIILILMNGRPLSITWAQNHLNAIVEAWHLGQQSGTAITQVVFGDYNPSGKLPVTFPRTVGQLPVYYNHRKIGGAYKVKYRDIENSPLYPFGFGLSYTTFEYTNLKLSAKKITVKESLTISIDVTNTGKKDGQEIVQLYIHDPVASMTRPVKELKGFKKIFLKAGETKSVQFELSPSEIGFYNNSMEYTVEQGAFKIYIGRNSEDLLESEFEIVVG